MVSGLTPLIFGGVGAYPRLLPWYPSTPEGGRKKTFCYSFYYLKETYVNKKQLALLYFASDLCEYYQEAVSE